MVEINSKADKIFCNGKIQTVDEEIGCVQAVAVKESRFVYAGGDEGVKSFIGPDTVIYDLNGKMALPGFIDSHAHPTMGVTLVAMAQLFNLPSPQAYVDEVKTFGENHADLPVIYGIGWNSGLFPPEGPKKEMVDAVIPDRPVALWADDLHSVWVNSKAIEACGITADTIPPAGAIIERYSSTGEASGTFRENAVDLISNNLQPISLEDMKRGILSYGKLAARDGITCVHDALLLTPEMAGFLMGFGLYKMNSKAFAELAAENKMKLRVRGSLYINPETEVGEVEKILLECSQYQNELFQIKSTKIFLDGVIESHTGFMLEPYCDRPGYCGKPVWEQAKLNEMIRALDKAGLQVHIHAISDGSARMALDAFEYAIKANGKRDARHQITHLQLVSEADYERFAEMGIIGVPQPMWCKKWSYYEDLLVPYLGKERAEKQFPMKSLIDAGVKLAGGSDFPICMPCPPLLGILGGVTRCEPGITDPAQILGAQERVSLSEMIECYTINGAYANFLENETGSIKVGKYADMVVLDQNIVELPPSEINKANVILTMFEGKIAYQDNSFASPEKRKPICPAN